jgi:prevent-host-death family protein
VNLHFWQHVKSMVTREFSRNPSSALRDAQDGPVVITKYGQPVACIASIEYWNSLLKQAQEAMLNEVDVHIPVDRRSARPLQGDSCIRD